MTSQEKIEYLGRYKALSRQIDRLLDERAEWMARATKITPTLSDMPKGGEQPNKIQLAVEKMTEIESEVDKKIDEAQTTKAEIMAAISGISCATYRKIFERMYLQGKTVKEIAKEFNCSRHKIYNIHDKVIKILNIVETIDMGHNMC